MKLPMAERETEKDRKPQQHDDDVVGKAYDSRLMGIVDLPSAI